MTCKDCVHYDRCKDIYDNSDETYGIWKNVFDDEMYAEYGCDFFVDKSHFIELPCKVGTYVYFITDVNGHCFTIKFGRVYEISMTSNDNLFLSVAEYDGSDNVVDEWNIPKCQRGKTVFLAREEAEKALKERKQ